MAPPEPRIKLFCTILIRIGLVQVCATMRAPRGARITRCDTCVRCDLYYNLHALSVTAVTVDRLLECAANRFGDLFLSRGGGVSDNWLVNGRDAAAAAGRLKDDIFALASERCYNDGEKSFSFTSTTNVIQVHREMRAQNKRTVMNAR